MSHRLLQTRLRFCVTSAILSSSCNLDFFQSHLTSLHVFAEFRSVSLSFAQACMRRAMLNNCSNVVLVYEQFVLLLPRSVLVHLCNLKADITFICEHFEN